MAIVGPPLRPVDITSHAIIKTLKVERLLQGKTLRDLEAEIGFSDTFINKIENETGKIPFRAVVALAAALGYELRLCPVSSKPILPTLPLSTTSPDPREKSNAV